MGFKDDIIREQQYFYAQTRVQLDDCCDDAELYCCSKLVAVKRVAVKQPPKLEELLKPFQQKSATPAFPVSSKESVQCDRTLGVSYGFAMNSLDSKYFRLGADWEATAVRENVLVETIREDAAALDCLTQRLNQLRLSATLRFSF